MVQYKARLIYIDVELIEESHTSKCSFLNIEIIEHHKQYLGKRIKGGLFKTRNGQLINADVNGAYNIIRKALPEAILADRIDILAIILKKSRMERIK